MLAPDQMNMCAQITAGMCDLLCRPCTTNLDTTSDYSSTLGYLPTSEISQLHMRTMQTFQNCCVTYTCTLSNLQRVHSSNGMRKYVQIPPYPHFLFLPTHHVANAHRAALGGYMPLVFVDAGGPFELLRACLSHPFHAMDSVQFISPHPHAMQ